jgi:DNA-binding winged helix-turn-helix (wHTH) protein
VNAITSPGQFPGRDVMIPRFRDAGDVTLDLFHRDGRIDDRWLGFHPREFALIWQLAEHPGERMTRRQLLAEVWRIHIEPETNSVAVHVARVRAKLEPYGLARLIAPIPKVGTSLMPRPKPTSAGSSRRRPAEHGPVLDSGLGIGHSLTAFILS